MGLGLSWGRGVGLPRLLPVFRREEPQREDRGRVERRAGRVGMRPLLAELGQESAQHRPFGGEQRAEPPRLARRAQ